MSLKLPLQIQTCNVVSKNFEECHCLLCQRGFIKFEKKPTWNTILKVIFYSLKKMFPMKEYFSLTTDIYHFITNHIKIFGELKHFKRKSQIWKKAMIDALSHSASFQTGFPIYGVNGYWKLIEETDPWDEEEKPNNGTWKWKIVHQKTKTYDVDEPREVDIKFVTQNPQSYDWVGSTPRMNHHELPYIPPNKYISVPIVSTMEKLEWKDDENFESFISNNSV
ncbi:hypothetical protein EHI8A_045510 [Entamoeba histolytica HM-1:IMSS-B]|uniref:Uncharacterized protein n=5 Tax=Entamoeba histolytica TaxID=5759 RepID=C4M0E9_ENTH1|nr:hypothetical protein, conserved [Entamoeba histolytica HM-1:IMSS]EMD48628.1 Hypothetical protein EHI5A_054440 [Entamoeba histolytica KU27]EMH74453.1 hypothetical protein EHI8A_045510 [Entamoeba histolytica HM-1:IMSS-B]ENY60482.1 hypothetical protein EHI7A_031280 [Entamoeba histolytica HM-1:IMSS-A]GAT94635.1 hypothetical protein conserved [Entamoeba histolytica]EAL49080.1 hypothetical protein, conserved [Entamoeba histolytica HM-1:IMSS]|eukprot:XP_654470.1 hypothetical protein, conserved [Entamoeba histolytica HM-1:IMSS]